MYNNNKTFTNFEKVLENNYHKGMIIVFIIAILNIIFAIISNIIGNFDISKIIVQIGLSIALFKGVKFVRYLFIASAFFSIIIYINIFLVYITQKKVTYIGTLICIALCLINSIISGSLLAFNKSVSDFLYYQRTR